MLGDTDPKFPLPPCRVCDAPGTGFHYGVNTCEACKGFFHRSLKQWTKYKCLNKRNCVIQHGSGILCRLCRYQRCLVMGMSKAAIKTGRYNYKKKTDDILEVKQLRANKQATAIACEGSLSIGDTRDYGIASGSPPLFGEFVIKQEISDDALDLSQLHIVTAATTTSAYSRAIGGDSKNIGDGYYAVTKTEIPDDGNDVETMAEQMTPFSDSLSRRSQQKNYPALLSVLSNTTKDLNYSNNNEVTREHLPSSPPALSPSMSSSLPSSSTSSLVSQTNSFYVRKMEKTTFNESRDYKSHSMSFPSPATSSPPSSSPPFFAYSTTETKTSSPYYSEQQMDEGYASSDTPPSSSYTATSMAPSSSNTATSVTHSKALKMPPLCYVPSASETRTYQKRSNQWCDSQAEHCTPPKLPSPMRILPNDSYFQTSSTFTPSTVPHVKTEVNVVGRTSYTSNPTFSEDEFNEMRNHQKQRSYYGHQNISSTNVSSEMPNSDWLRCSVEKYPKEKANDVLKATKREISQIDAAFSNYDFVLDRLVMANDEYVQPYFQEVSKEENRKHLKEKYDSGETSDGGVYDEDRVRTTVSDFAKTMEDTIRVMVSFAMAIPGFEGLPKSLKIDLIKNSRQEFCLLNLSKCIGPNTKLHTGAHVNGVYSAMPEFSEYRICLTAIFGFMDKFQRLALTHEECVVLRALAIMAPDRVNPMNSLVLTAIYDQLVNLLIFLLGKRLNNPMPFFAKLTSFITECRTKEQELTSKFRTLNVQSSMLLRDKPFLKLMFSGIYS